MKCQQSEGEKKKIDHKKPTKKMEVNESERESGAQLFQFQLED